MTIPDYPPCTYNMSFIHGNINYSSCSNLCVKIIYFIIMNSAQLAQESFPMANCIHLFSIHSWDRRIRCLHVGNAVFVLPRLLYLYLPYYWLQFYNLLTAKGHISMKINFILDPLGADISVNLCQEIQNDGKEEVSVFYIYIILSCFPDNGAREDLETGSIFLPCSSLNNG